jgi:hypothetical protein
MINACTTTSLPILFEHIIDNKNDLRELLIRSSKLHGSVRKRKAET